jgi:tetratricopeptide (TPR) repeat protein
VRPVTVVAAGIALAVTLAAQSQLGRLTFPTSGPAPAQAQFIRGVTLLHNFEYDEAILAFREAERLAPGFAMAHWGEALSYSQPLWYNEDVTRARDALTRLAPTPAARAAKAPTPREKGWLDAVERLFGDGDRSARQRAYADRMALLARDFPDDDEAQTFHALALLATIPEGERRPDVSLKAGAIAAAVFKKNPQHPGAAHYMLHAYDDGEHNGQALQAARTYAKIAPASSHALHMPSHVFLPLGMWDEAVASDEASWNASVAWVKRTSRTADQRDFHSLSWLHYEYLQQGRFAKARELEAMVRSAVEQSPKASATASSSHHVESEIGRGYGPMSLRNELASMRARDVVESRAFERMKEQGNFDNIDELFAVGFAGIMQGDAARGKAAIEQLQTAGRTLSDRDAAEVSRIMASELTGVLLFVSGDRERGLAEVRRAVDLEAARPRPIARPYPIKPAIELYAELLLASGDARAAMRQFSASLTRTPRRAASLYGLASAAGVAGDATEASKAAKEFLGVWRLADTSRSELADMRQLVR